MILRELFKTKARKMKDTNSLDEINEWYSNQIEEIINTSLDDILTVYKVIL